MERCAMSFENLPAHPGEWAATWLDDARLRSAQPNWNVMMLATAGAASRPSVRAVLLKAFDPQQCRIRFFTNYRSRKAREMTANHRVAVAMYWDALERQLRFEGDVVPLSSDESDAYFATRPRESQIGAWASEQSEPIEHYDELVRRAAQIEAQYAGRTIPRPPHWGGYGITADLVEFWQGKPGRVHQRVAYVRSEMNAQQWTRRWLSP